MAKNLSLTVLLSPSNHMGSFTLSQKVTHIAPPILPRLLVLSVQLPLLPAWPTPAWGRTF